MQGMTTPKLTLCACCGKHKLFRHIGIGCSIVMDNKYKDLKGCPIWYPNNNDNPYFDKAFQRVFKNKKDKKSFMNKNKIIMDGSDHDNPNRHRDPTAGDTMGSKKPIYSRKIKEKKDV